VYRFIYLKDCGIDSRFAFFDTISDFFIEGVNGPAWGSISDIRDDPKLSPQQKERMISLIPDDIKTTNSRR